MVSMRTTRERFNSHISDTPHPKGCKVWKSRKSEKGYGEFFVDGKKQRATRWLMEQKLGRPLTREELVLHTCDNPPCVNEDHLYLGNHSQNAKDKYSRGRDQSQLRTHCPKGHEFTEENTYWWGPQKTRRKCKTCRREQGRARRAAEQ
jgi:hypothetical protein